MLKQTEDPESGQTSSDIAPGGNKSSRVEPNGSLHTRELTFFPSELWSSQFKKFYAQTVLQTPERSDFPVPARTASKVEWDRFDAWANDYYFAEPLAWLKNTYQVDVDDTKIAGVHVGVVSPKHGIAPENRRRILINLHGGGFVYNRGLSFGQVESIPVAAIGRIKVVTLDYRQAPFHSYPSASEDVAAVYEELLRQHEPEAIGIYGCSAGGTLTAQSVSWFQANGMPRPGAAGLLSIGLPPPCVPAPWQRGWGESEIWFSGFPKNGLSEADKKLWEPVRWYMEGVDLHDPTAYPGSCDAVLAKFPPTLFLSGTRDFALSAAITAHARLLKLRVDTSLYVMEGAPHAAHAMAVGTPEAHDAQTHIARWFLQRLAT